ncbi:MAG: hypothetical protein WCF36_01720 [Candidatus Nanopelagicales bacterium]
MIIDCDGCQMRDLACDDCVVTFLLGPPGGLGSAEQTALAVLADGGLVPPLRMLPGAGRDGRSGGPGTERRVEHGIGHGMQPGVAVRGAAQHDGRRPGAATA